MDRSDDHGSGGRSDSVLTCAGLDALIHALTADGFRVIGPRLRDDAIVLDEIGSVDDLPSGWGVTTGPGHYRVRRRDDPAMFGHSAGPQSWKQFLHPPRRDLFTADADGFAAVAEEPVRYAFLGVRACDLAAVASLASVLDGRFPDAGFVRRRRGLFVVAVGCTEPGGVCFCASTGTGPAPGPGFDLALTERVDADGHRFLVEVGTDAGAAILAAVPRRAAGPAETADARAAVAAAAGRMGRVLPPTDLPALLTAGRESPVWEDVAQRCLSCTNCTMVCPTCFCTSVEDRTDLGAGPAVHSRRWASCFEADFSYVHGGRVRGSVAGRYRQWITHKLGTWGEQFGTPGCVGCGRCIAWCPAGIDITAELSRLAADVGSAPTRDPT